MKKKVIYKITRREFEIIEVTTPEEEKLIEELNKEFERVEKAEQRYTDGGVPRRACQCVPSTRTTPSAASRSLSLIHIFFRNRRTEIQYAAFPLEPLRPARPGVPL